MCGTDREGHVGVCNKTASLPGACALRDLCGTCSEVLPEMIGQGQGQGHEDADLDLVLDDWCQCMNQFLSSRLYEVVEFANRLSRRSRR